MTITEEIQKEISGEMQETPINPEMEQANIGQMGSIGQEFVKFEPQKENKININKIKTRRTKTRLKEPLEPLKFLPEWSPELNKKFIGDFRGFKVFTVSGEFVRNSLEADFTMGSHHYMSSFIPEGEVWLDEKMSENDRIALIHHEIHETKLMKEGMSYEQAHASATRSELRLRKKKFNNKHKNLPLTLFCSFVHNPSKTL